MTNAAQNGVIFIFAFVIIAFAGVVVDLDMLVGLGLGLVTGLLMGMKIQQKDDSSGEVGSE